MYTDGHLPRIQRRISLNVHEKGVLRFGISLLCLSHKLRVNLCVNNVSEEQEAKDQ